MATDASPVNDIHKGELLTVRFEIHCSFHLRLEEHPVRMRSPGHEWLGVIGWRCSFQRAWISRRAREFQRFVIGALAARVMGIDGHLTHYTG